MKRRKFIKIVASIIGLLIAPFKLIFIKDASGKIQITEAKKIKKNFIQNLGTEIDGKSYVHMVKGSLPERNMEILIDGLGGINKFIEHNDMVVIKVNAQRYNQGMSNTDQLKGLIDQILISDGFKGEIIVTDNHQYEEDDCCGWTTDERNGKYNFNELIDLYQRSGYPNVTKYHWHVAGSCEYPLEGTGQGENRVAGPEDGDGYVWMADNYYTSPNGRKCLMTYPIFTSTYSGITIDLMKGAWKDGEYINNKVKLINFSTLNHHGFYTGVSASIKNLMGIVDMTCGFPGDTPSNTYNTHHIGVSKFKHYLYYKAHWRLKRKGSFFRKMALRYCYRNFHHTGGALGHFMATVKMPDLHILASEIVGWGGRKDPKKAIISGTVLASKDPVALDYIGAKYVLLPITPKKHKVKDGDEYLIELHDPDIKNGKFRKFLLETHMQGIGNLSEKKIEFIRMSDVHKA